MTVTQEEYLVQRNYGGIWINFGNVCSDLKFIKNHIKNLKGEFRIFKRTVTNWEEVKQ